MVLQQLQKNNLYLKPTKCEFNKTRIEYLRMIVEEEKLAIDPIKLGGIRDWPTPTTVKMFNNFWNLETLTNTFLGIELCG